MRTFLESLYSKQFEVLIVSAGVKNYIVNFFTYHWFDMARMNIVWNEFETDDGWKAIGYDKNLITAYTKQHLDYKQYWISDKEFAIQFWDSLWDAHIVNDHFKKENILTVWITGGDTWRDKSFCELFDIVLETEDGEIDEILKLLKN